MAKSGFLSKVGVDRELEEEIQRIGRKAPNFLKKVYRSQEESANEILRELVHENRKELKSGNIVKFVEDFVQPKLNNETPLDYSEKEAAILLFKETATQAEKCYEKYENRKHGSDQESFEEAYKELLEFAKLWEVSKSIMRNYNVFDLSGCTLDHLLLIFDELEREYEVSDSDITREEALEIIENDENRLRELEKVNERNSKDLETKLERMSRLAYDRGKR